MVMPDFDVIHPGSVFGTKLKFTENKFGGYLCLQDKTIWISAIISKNPGQHNLTHLFNRILKLGYEIKVPSPFPKMEEIVKAKGFVRTIEHWEETGEDIDVWCKHA